MTRSTVCGIVFLSLACSSSGSTGGSGGSGASAGQGPDQAGAAGVGSPTSGGAGGASAGGVSAGGAGAGAPAANAGAPAANGGAPAANAGASGRAGSGPSAGAAGVAATGESVTQRGADSARTSHWVAPSLTKANVMAKFSYDADFKANFDGELTGSPLFLAGAAAGTGRFYAATTENDVYALDELTGAVVWKHNIGGYLVNAPVCGSDPKHHGIVSTPVIDAAKRTIYVAAAMTDGHHEIHALSTDTGEPLTAGWPIDVSKIKAGSLAFPSSVQNQRSALSLVNGVLYVAFGGYCGDAGNYHGWVIGVDAADPTKIGAWATMDPRQSGIWAAGGLASDGNGVFAVTGNYQGAVSGSHDNTDSEEILRITGLGVGNRDSKNLFYPAEWATPMNSADQDFGSCSPAVVTVPDAKPSTIVVAPAKPGRVYFLDAANLGGSLGQFADLAVANTSASSLFTTPTAYTSPAGTHVALSTGTGSQCPKGASNSNVMGLLLKPAAPGQAPMPSIKWCATISGGDTAKRAPISTNSSGSADPIVWYLNGSNLNGFDGEDGTTLYDSSKGASPSSCTGVHKFTTLIAVNGRIVAGGDTSGKAHLCSWSVH